MMDEGLLRWAIEVARRAIDQGNHPYGAVLADQDGQILLETGNTVITQQDLAGHGEMNLIRKASRKLIPQHLATCTLYSSTEPCPMW